MSIRDIKAGLAGLTGLARPLASDVAGMVLARQVWDLPALIRRAPRFPLDATTHVG